MVLATKDGRIVLENTLDARLEVVFKQQLPEVCTITAITTGSQNCSLLHHHTNLFNNSLKCMYWRLHTYWHVLGTSRDTRTTPSKTISKPRMPDQSIHPAINEFTPLIVINLGCCFASMQIRKRLFPSGGQAGA